MVVFMGVAGMAAGMKRKRVREVPPARPHQGGLCGCSRAGAPVWGYGAKPLAAYIGDGCSQRCPTAR